LDPFHSPCPGCQYPTQVIPPCPNCNHTSPKVVLVVQAPGSGALCSQHVCRYNWRLKSDDVTALTVDWVFHSLGVHDTDLLTVNALRCANQEICYHALGVAENTRRGVEEYRRCAWALSVPSV
jgi:hypothetical protein